MKLSDEIYVSDRFQRSIRIDSDLNDEAVINSFVCPQSSADVLLNMARSRKKAGEAAFTWTGPYGSGKSSLAVILNALLGTSQRLRESATEVLGVPLSHKIFEGFDVTDCTGWTFVPIVGSRGSLLEPLNRALKEVCRSQSQLTNDNFALELMALAERQQVGLFIVIDELGKCLESVADGQNDIYMFQQLAEIAARSSGKIIVLGILHQSFAEYSRRLSKTMRDEWAKVQGRFLDHPINVAGEELIDLIGRAIKSSLKPCAPTQIDRVVATHISLWRPTNEKLLAKSLSLCWPLHPVTASLLGSISRRRFGQNQRSVFGFLNSAEPFGFQEFIRGKGSRAVEIYEPARLWDYLKANLEPSIMASPDGHKWSISVDALFRVDALERDEKTSDILKCIALMDLFHERTGLVPSKEILLTCIQGLTEAELGHILSCLESQSIIRFKKYKKAFSIWEGSDFDIEVALTEASAQLPELAIERIRLAARFQPVVAKRHYHETGALRWFDVDIVPSEQAIQFAEAYRPSESGAMGLVMIVLDSSASVDEGDLCQKASVANKKWPVFVSVARNSSIIQNHAKELQSLEFVRANSPLLGGDTVARREVDSRLADVKDRLEDNLSYALSSAKWFIDGAEPKILSFKELHSFVSQKANLVYHSSPCIVSELMNRVKPSSNSMAALKQLLRAMVENNGQERLGIVGYPAEGGLYDTLLARTSLYGKLDVGFGFMSPSSVSDTARLHALWKKTDTFFQKRNSRVVALPELYEMWADQPFGIKDGLHAFVMMSYLMTRLQNYAIYCESIYRPSIDSLFIDYLLKSPKDISLRVMNFSAIGQKILAGVVITLNALHPTERPLVETSEPLEIARRLVATVMNVAPWVLRTRHLSKNAIKLRELIKNATDPNKVLFDDLPSLFKEHEISLSKGDVQPIIHELSISLNEIVSAYPALMDSFKEQLCSELDVDDKSGGGLEEINFRAKNIMQATGDFKLDAFAMRLAGYHGSTVDIEGIVSLASDKPTRDWIDIDVSRARLRVAELSQQFNHVEAYGRVLNREDYRHAVAFTVGLNGTPRTYVSEFTVKKSQQKVISNLEKKLSEVLSVEENLSDDLVLAALANIGAKILQKNDSKK